MFHTFNAQVVTAASSKCSKSVQEASFTENAFLIKIHQIVGPTVGFAQTSHVLWQEQVVMSPAVKMKSISGQITWDVDNQLLQ